MQLIIQKMVLIDYTFVHSAFVEKLIGTIRERPKSAPYLRLKNSKRTSKLQIFSSTVPG